MQGDEEEEPFPRGRKRAAPLTVRKFSLILMTRTVTERESKDFTIYCILII